MGDEKVVVDIKSGFAFHAPSLPLTSFSSLFVALFALVKISENFLFTYIRFSFAISLHVKGEMEVTPACYTHLLSSLLSLASGRVAVVLEGGYCLESLAEGAALTLRTLLGDPCPRMEPLDAPCERFEAKKVDFRVKLIFFFLLLAFKTRS